MPRIVIPARRGILIAGIAALCLVLAGVVVWRSGQAGGAAPGSRPAEASATTAPGSEAGTGPGASRASGARSPTQPAGTPSDDATSGFLTEVAAINSALVADPGHAVAAGKATCEDIGAHKPDEEIVRAARERFAVRNVAITDITAVLLVGASRNHLCPG